MRRLRNSWLAGAGALMLVGCGESNAPPPPPAKLAFSVQPTGATAGAPITPAVAVVIEDASSNQVSSATGPVTMALGANPGNGTLAGTTVVNAVNGVAIFTDLSIRQPSSGYTLTASSGSLQGTTSAPFAIAPFGAPATLTFTVEPSNASAGVAINPAVAVAIEDAFGNAVTSATDAVTVGLRPNPGAATLAGTLTVNAVRGVATFSNLSIGKASNGWGYTLTATSGTLSGAASAPFAITPAAPAALSFVVPPSTAGAGGPISPAVQVAIQDAFANTVTSATNLVTLTLGANPGGATLSGTLTASAANGVASFPNLSLDRPASGYTLLAASGALTGATSPPFAITKTLVIAFVLEDQGGSHRGIATMHDDGSSVVSLTTSGEAPKWSPDGARIAFLGNSGVFVMNADGSAVVNILQGPGLGVTGLAWKPDGSRLAFSGSYNYESGLFLIAPDGSNVTRILPGPGYGMYPSWSPDGLRLVVACPVTSGICVVNADGTGLVQLLPSGLQPVLKPDGTRILFVAAAGLSLMNPDGSGMTPLLSYAGALLPAWSFEGQRIAFVAPGGCVSYSSSGCYTTAPDTLHVANADGSGLSVLKPAGTEPAWRP